MTIEGWIFMIISWAVIIGLFIFCMTRTLRPAKKASAQEKQKEDTESSAPMSS
jgi:uncharacterized membrane protein